MKQVTVILLVAITLAAYKVTCVPISRSEGLLITPDNVRYLASFIASSAVFNQLSIHFNSGSLNEKLIEVPLVPAGEFDSHTSIRITVGFDPSGPNTPGRDHDPQFGITDGTNINIVQIPDVNNYSNFPPCHPLSATSPNNLVSASTPAPGVVTFLFTPFHRYGACYTAQEGGYTNVGLFNAQLDLSKGINFIVRRSDGPEQYDFYYFIIELV